VAMVPFCCSAEIQGLWLQKEKEGRNLIISCLAILCVSRN
jgi:hypothetical protein